MINDDGTTDPDPETIAMMRRWLNPNAQWGDEVSAARRRELIASARELFARHPDLKDD